MADCPDLNAKLEEAIQQVEETFVDALKDNLGGTSKDLDEAVKNLPPGPAEEQLKVLCAAITGSADSFNDARISCGFDPTGCLREVLDSGILGGTNPALAGAILAGATFVDAISGNLENPLISNGIFPSADIGVTPPTIPVDIDLPNFPAPPPSDDCPDPVNLLNEALQSAEETFLDLHKKATQKLSDEINDVLGGIGGLPTQVQASALCITAEAGFDIAGGLTASCSIDVGECIKQVLESGIFGAAISTLG